MMKRSPLHSLNIQRMTKTPDPFVEELRSFVYNCNDDEKLAEMISEMLAYAKELDKEDAVGVKGKASEEAPLSHTDITPQPPAQLPRKRGRRPKGSEGKTTASVHKATRRNHNSEAFRFFRSARLAASRLSAQDFDLPTAFLSTRPKKGTAHKKTPQRFLEVSQQKARKEGKEDKRKAKAAGRAERRGRRNDIWTPSTPSTDPTSPSISSAASSIMDTFHSSDNDEKGPKSVSESDASMIRAEIESSMEGVETSPLHLLAFVAEVASRSNTRMSSTPSSSGSHSVSPTSESCARIRPFLRKIKEEISDLDEKLDRAEYGIPSDDQFGQRKKKHDVVAR